MRIAYISVHACPLASLGHKEAGGMNVYLRETALELGRRGVCVDIFTRCHAPFEPEIIVLAPNVRIIHLEAGLWSEPKERLFNHLPEFSRMLDAFVRVHDLTYDLVHGHYWLSGVVALDFRRHRQMPVVASFHSLGEVQRRLKLEGGEHPERVPMERRIAAEADQLVAGSPDEREQIVRVYGAPLQTAHVAPLGYDDKLFYPRDKTAARRALGLTGSRIVLFVGRMDRIKGVEIVLRASAAIDGKDGLQVVMIGGGARDAEMERMKRLARQLGIEANLVFRGAVDQSILPDYYSAADVCIVPSYYETFGMVAVESMACGTPVIAARVGGLQATIADGRTGYLVAWHCPEPYAERLETILGNAFLRAGFGRAALESVANMTWSFTVDNLLDVYGKTLGLSRIAHPLAPCA